MYYLYLPARTKLINGVNERYRIDNPVGKYHQNRFTRSAATVNKLSVSRATRTYSGKGDAF